MLGVRWLLPLAVALGWAAGAAGAAEVECRPRPRRPSTQVYCRDSDWAVPGGCTQLKCPTESACSVPRAHGSSLCVLDCSARCVLRATGAGVTGAGAGVTGAGATGAGVAELHLHGGGPLQLREVLSTAPTLRGLTTRRTTLQLQAGSKSDATSRSQLQRLDVECGDVSALPAFAFSAAPLLSELRLRHSGLQLLHEDSLAGLQQLAVLDLSDNHLTALPTQLLQPVGATLQRILFDRNDLKNIGRDVFKHLECRTNNTTVSVEDNQLRTVDKGWFGGWNSVESSGLAISVSLAGNQLSLEEGAGGDALEYVTDSECAPRSLDLSRNCATVPPAYLRDHTQQLAFLNLSHNHIRKLDENYFSFVETIEVTVDLRHNLIASVELNETEYMERRCRTTPPPEANNHCDPVDNLEAHLLLEGNPLHCSAAMLPLVRRLQEEPALARTNPRCVTPPALRGIYLRASADLLEREPPPLCAPCVCSLRPAVDAYTAVCAELPTSALPLPASANLTVRLTRAPSSLIALPAQAVRLELAGLELDHLPPLPSRSALRQLDLRNNSLTTPPLEPLQRGLRLLLAGNPLACDCQHQAALRYLRSNENLVDDRERVACANGTALLELRPQHLCEEDTQNSHTLEMLVGAVIIVFVVLAMLAFALMRWRRWKRAQEPNTGDEYDVFVVFSYSDRVPVMGGLVSRLEARGYRVLASQRDFAAGEAQTLLVSEAVRRARRTLLVVSPASSCCPWTLHAARETHGDDGESPKRLLAVLLEDPPPSLSQCSPLLEELSDAVVLRWGEARFWQHLFLEMPPRSLPARFPPPHCPPLTPPKV